MGVDASLKVKMAVSVAWRLQFPHAHAAPGRQGQRAFRRVEISGGGDDRFQNIIRPVIECHTHLGDPRPG